MWSDYITKEEQVIDPGAKVHIGIFILENNYLTKWFSDIKNYISLFDDCFATFH